MFSVSENEIKMSLFQVANLRIQALSSTYPLQHIKTKKKNNLNNKSYNIKQLHIEYTFYILEEQKLMRVILNNPYKH